MGHPLHESERDPIGLGNGKIKPRSLHCAARRAKGARRKKSGGSGRDGKLCVCC